MKRLNIISLLLLFFFIFHFFASTAVLAQTPPVPTPSSPYRPCRSMAPDPDDPTGTVYPESFCPNLDNVNSSDTSTYLIKNPNYDGTGSRPGNQYYSNCASSYEEYLANPAQNFWVDDPDVTSLGRGGERSRQFLLWALTHNSLDNNQTIISLWQISRNIAYFFILIIAIFLGLGLIVGQRNNFDLKVEVTPIVTKILILLIYITFSATIVLLIIQISDIMMEFFIRTLKVRELFNIFFVAKDTASGNPFADSEQAYQSFRGCTNLNTLYQESVSTSKFLVKFTNMTYYFFGIMVILRKVVLWFLLILAPFLSILAPFIFIRNIGWIWIGVFFQWVFYGPLMALFLGSLARIWNSDLHIPYIFDFSRVGQMAQDQGKIIYPTTINILYGGPAQQLQTYNTSSYVDTFAEYVISLIMLWTVLILPWWLLRIFRDYCCDGIMAMKNVLMAMYDSLKSGGFPPAPSGPGDKPTPTGTAGMAKPIPTQKIREREVDTRVSLTSIEDVKRAKTNEITNVMQISASKLTDVARFETNKETRENAIRNIEHLSNPMKAQTATERQKFMSIRNELYERATKKDVLAQRLVSSVSSSESVRESSRQEFSKSLPKAVPVIRTTSVKVGLAMDRTERVIKSIFNAISNNSSVTSHISKASQVAEPTVRQILQQTVSPEITQMPAVSVAEYVAKKARVEKVKVESVLANTANLVLTKDVKDTVAKEVSVKTGKRKETVRTIIDKYIPASQTLETAQSPILTRISAEVGVPVGQLNQIVQSTADTAARRKEVIAEIAQLEKMDEKTVEKVAEAQVQTLAKPQEHIEETVAMPSTVSIEDYEEVKKMWVDQYEHSEPPLSETIKSRAEWLETDVIALTNILNKIMSADEKIRNEGLQEVGYILPIFMINNLKGDELAVYLKAKLEAAKQVKNLLEERERAKQEVESQEEFVEIARPKETQAERTMTMQESLKMQDPRSSQPQNPTAAASQTQPSVEPTSSASPHGQPDAGPSTTFVSQPTSSEPNDQITGSSVNQHESEK